MIRTCLKVYILIILVFRKREIIKISKIHASFASLHNVSAP